MELLLALSTTKNETEIDANNHDNEGQAVDIFHNNVQWNEHALATKNSERNAGEGARFENIVITGIMEQENKTTHTMENVIPHANTATELRKKTPQRE